VAEAQKPIPTFEQIGETIKQIGKSVPMPPVAFSLESHWYLVVAGHIDYRQHTPLWYKLIDAINDEEFENAKRTLLFNPPPTMIGIRFDAGDFSLNCQPDRLELATKYKAKRSRLIDVASLVFKKLWEITTIAYGFHSQLVLPTRLSDAPRTLYERMSPANIGLSDFNDRIDIEYKVKNTKSDSSATLITVGGSPFSRSDIILTCVKEYAVGEQKGYYDISDLMRPKAEADWQAADDLGVVIVNTIDGQAGEKHAG
jgi:hypothetical protein